jgi:hypothetical protein
MRSPWTFAFFNISDALPRNYPRADALDLGGRNLSTPLLPE